MAPAGYDELFVDDILAGISREAADRAVSEYRRLRSVDKVLDSVLYPALVEVGRRWRDDIIGVAEEHAATSSLRAAARLFFESNSPEPDRELFLAITCVPGDEHELGAEILSLYLDFRGWTVYFMGRSMPEPDIVRELKRGGYRAVLLSVSLVRHLPAFENIVKSIRKSNPDIYILTGEGALGQAARVLKDIADDRGRRSSQKG